MRAAGLSFFCKLIIVRMTLYAALILMLMLMQEGIDIRNELRNMKAGKINPHGANVAAAAAAAAAPATRGEESSGGPDGVASPSAMGITCDVNKLASLYPDEFWHEKKKLSRKPKSRSTVLSNSTQRSSMNLSAVGTGGPSNTIVHHRNKMA